MEMLGISSEHFPNVQSINQYIEEHRINSLMNVSSTL